MKGLAFNLEENSVAVIILGDYLKVTEGMEVRTTGELLSRAGRRGDDRPRRRSARQPARRQGADPHRRSAARSNRPAPGIVDRQPVKQPLQTGIKAIDSMTPDRPRPARTHHRRPQDRQDRHRHRHDHQPEGRERHLRLRGVRADGIEGRRRGREAPRSTGAMDYTIVVVASAADAGPAAVLSPRTPGPRWPSTSCTRKARTRSACTTTCRSRPPRIASFRCSCAVRRAAKPIPATCSIATRRLLERSAKLAEQWVIVADDTDDTKVDGDWGINTATKPTEATRPGRSGQGLRRARRSRRARPGQARPEELPRRTRSPRSRAPAAR